MPYIIDVYAKEVLDSRGNPTVEVDITSESGAFGRCIVPSGASTGSKEVHELRDGNPNRYNGLGVTKAVKNINEIIAPEIIGYDVSEQIVIDAKLKELDGTKDLSNLGANAILAVSLAVSKAACDFYEMPYYKYLGGMFARILPTPLMNVLNGGRHASFAMDFQEIMIVPVSAPTFKEAIRMGSEVFHALKDVLEINNFSTAVGDEGGFAPKFTSNTQPFDLIIESIKKAGYIPGKDVFIAIDVAASELFKDGFYVFKLDNKKFSSIELIDYYEKLINKYPIISIEDGLDEQDYIGFANLTKRLGSKIQLVGDDLFATNKTLLQKGISESLSNAILIKPNQIGTLTDTFETINLASINKFGIIVSHRSGDSEDTTIADLSVAVNCGQIKTGSLCRSERIAKYNQLIRIEDELDSAAIYSGITPFLKFLK